MYRSLLLPLLTCFYLTTFAQVDFCIEHSHLEQLLVAHPAILQRHTQIEQDYLNNINNFHTSASRSGGPLYQLPVVVHIIHNGGTENISDAQVIQGIQDLNDAYANVGYYDSLTGVDTRIQFCLAKRDPAGVITTGITRNQSSLTNMDMDLQDLAVKNLNRWNPDCYINIWLVKEICSSSSGSCGVAGYAYFPSAAGTNIDGIMAEARWFGSTRANSCVHIHEMGHYLGLYHTFQGGCTNNNCLTDGDHVCDTRPDATTAHVACSAAPNSCTTDALSGFTNDGPDLISDYMDYSDLSCYSVFTQGQATRMQWHIQNYRLGLTTCPSCLNPCATPVTASIQISAHQIVTGQQVTMSGTATNAVKKKWYVDGVLIDSTGTTNYTFNLPGVYVLKFKAEGGTPSCYDEKLDTITVTCAVVANFTYPNSTVAPGVSTTFTNTGTLTGNYQWLVNHQIVSTSTNLNYTFPANGVYWVQLRTIGSNCSTESDSIRVFVCNPCIEICDNGIDDDGDNLFDCLDPDCHCQECSGKQANNWYFGLGAGLTFNTNPPTPLTDGQHYQSEGSASISDANGHLLFYTDGHSVWNRNHVLMPNGNNLLGYGSSTSCLIVNHPGVKHKFYIFHTGTADNVTTMGIRYTEVDLSLNFGLGDVPVNRKNLPLVNIDSASEQLSAVRHCNNKFIWVGTHDHANNLYRAYLIDSQGLHTTPVRSLGLVTGAATAGYDCIGYMKFSPDGKKAARCFYNSQKIELMDFDNATGKFSHPVIVDNGTNNNYYYGLEFSPNSKLLYCSTLNTPYTLLQYEISNNFTTQSIQNSKILLATGSGYPWMGGELQLGPDRKIYMVKPSSTSAIHYDSLDIIKFPDIPGLGCAFTPHAIYMNGPQVNFGLPCFIQNYFISNVKIDGVDSFCQAGQSVTLKLLAEKSCEAVTTWTLINGPASITQQNDSNCTLSIIKDGIIKVAVDVQNTCNSGKDTFTIKVGKASNLNLGPDTSLCYAGIKVLHAGPAFAQYRWNDGSIDSTLTVYSGGKFWVNVVDYCGNAFSDSIILNIDSSTAFNFHDTTYCANRKDSISFHAPDGYQTYQWTPSLGLSCTQCQSPHAKPTTTTTYTCNATTKDGCAATGSINVKVTECLGVLEEVTDNFRVYPNPANKQLTIHWPSHLNPSSFVIYDALGQVVLIRPLRMQEKDYTLDLRNIACGVYILQLEGLQEHLMFVKQN
ncbi:MAG: M43 family zinc metalloprotease [Chitinophagales bacterium]